MQITFNKLGRYGRFCNQMYQVAGTIGIALKNGVDFGFPLWLNHDHKSRFGSTEDIDLYKHFKNELPIIKESDSWFDMPVDWGYHDIRIFRQCSISGHLQSRRYFNHCYNLVCHYLEMKDEPEKTDYVAIHVRRGDYDDKYHPRIGIKYYAAAVDKFPLSTRFMVFSDEPNLAQAMFVKQFGNDKHRFTFVRGNDYITDFKLMKSCKGFIIANSSFSAMAATLNRGAKVVAPINWFGPAWGTGFTTMAKDIYCPEWTVV